MLKKIKEYIQYKREIRKVKKEALAILNNVLPLVTTTSSNALKIIGFLINVAKVCNNLGENELMDRLQSIFMETIKTFADKFETDETRIYEIIEYMAKLSPADIQKVISYAQVKTLKNDK